MLVAMQLAMIIATVAQLPAANLIGAMHLHNACMHANFNVYTYVDYIQIFLEGLVARSYSIQCRHRIANLISCRSQKAYPVRVILSL